MSEVVSPSNTGSKWVGWAMVTIVFWGIWGALIAYPESHQFPAELGFVMWATSMVVPALVALKRQNWHLDRSARAILLGSVIGLLGGIGQLILYTGAIANGPAYLIFPIISMSPVVTIVLSLMFLKESVSRLGVGGIALAILAIPFLNYSDDKSGQMQSLWLAFALLVFVFWGVQGYYLKVANNDISAESIFFYMMLTSLLISPVAWLMADAPLQANWGWSGAGAAFAIGMLNAFGALALVYAFRFGKAIVVSPMVNCLPPIITSVLSLILIGVWPEGYAVIGIVLALSSAFLLALGEQED